MPWTIGVDVGGTFTDLHAVDPASGRVCLHKTASTPDDPARAILDGIDALIAAAGIAPGDVERVAHGTTVGTNALIQRRGGRVGVVTTEGFRDLLEIGRQVRPRLYDLQTDNPPPLAAREHRFEVRERIGPRGEVLIPLDDAAIAAVVRAVAAAELDACAVCLLFAFVNPEHEQRIGAALAAALPDLQISLSSEVQPEFREYERFSTTLLNAFLQPTVGAYLGRLERALAARFPRAHLGISQSSGGLMSARRARAVPVRTALSGPAAGAMGAIDVARASGHADVITLDMGGTSADVCLIRDHRAGVSYTRNVADFPVRLPMVDINTVGAGGGSVAWFDRDGLLKVGPRSAGAVPGPACYRLGGTEPTVTDANVVLGRLSPAGLLDGAMRLDPVAAEAAIAPLAARLGFSVQRTALGILDIVAANMVRAIRGVSVERGHDPRDFALMAFGGAGALHASMVAHELGIRTVVVPPAPGILCAQGLVASGLAEDFVRSVRVTLTPETVGAVVAARDALHTEAAAWLASEGVGLADATFSLALDMRYVGQNFELPVPVDDAHALPALDALAAGFAREHEQSYGYSNASDPVEVVNVRLAAAVALGDAETARIADAAAPPAPLGERAVWFAADEPSVTVVHHRHRLSAGHHLEGPAIVEQLDATTVVLPGDRARVDAAGNLIIEVRA
ncbi:MAG: hydantoinase/oxoprolinase family protein [Ectothiorhodospiraceae bacterium]|nr:hydantoinase/oxoprolinase family protein [Ectothiorhodospiraceae bacterium]